MRRGVVEQIAQAQTNGASQGRPGEGKSARSGRCGAPADCDRRLVALPQPGVFRWGGGSGGVGWRCALDESLLRVSVPPTWLTDKNFSAQSLKALPPPPGCRLYISPAFSNRSASIPPTPLFKGSNGFRQVKSASLKKGDFTKKLKKASVRDNFR